ncbi:MAG: hypothetical protein E7400_01260 [Ruminococcaceae bacterium]|nr:hypothetical protein [Oscillospiraceae bacterium]
MQKIRDFIQLHKRPFMISTIALAAALALGITIACITSSTLSYDKIYQGVFVGDLDISNLTVDEAKTKINEHFNSTVEGTVLLQCDNVKKEVNLADFAAGLDIDATAKEAYSIGRSGSMFEKLQAIHNAKKNKAVITPHIFCDDAMLETTLKEMASQLENAGREMELTVGDNELTVTRGTSGNYIDISEAILLFKKNAYSLDGKPLVLAVNEINPAAPNAKAIHDKISGQPVDASYKIENQRLIIIDDKPGVSFDIDAAQAVIDQSTGDTITIPITLTRAAVTRESLQTQLFPDKLGTYTTRYNARDVSRSYNVSLASQKINEVVLAPGDVFSYNDTVGPRTVDRGFKIANVYVGNQVEPGVGGGICQVSTTLFNTVVLSDLEIVFRTNHSLPVTYAPLGRDATVAYGSIDFKFKNNTDNPIRIVASATGGANTVTIYGVKENKNKTIEITTECTGTYPSRVVQKEDPTLPAETVKVEQHGSAGSSHNTYKITKENGVVIKTELLTKSTYVATDHIELIGTMPPEEADLPEAEGTENPSVSESDTPISPNAGGTSPIVPINPAAGAPTPEQ